MSTSAVSTVVVHTRDLERAAGFYERILGLARVHADESMVTLDADGVSILLHPSKDVQPSRHGVSVTFRSADVDGLVERARVAGCEVTHGPSDEPYGVRDAGLLDPDGHPVWVEQPLT